MFKKLGAMLGLFFGLKQDRSYNKIHPPQAKRITDGRSHYIPRSKRLECKSERYENKIRRYRRKIGRHFVRSQFKALYG